MAYLLDELTNIKNSKDLIQQKFSNKEIDKQTAQTSLQELVNRTEGLNDQLITEFSDLPTDQSTRAIGFYYRVKGEVMQALTVVNPTTSSTIEQSMAPPTGRNSKSAQNDLTANVSKLRNSLQNIKRAITETQNQNELTFNDIQDKSTTKEISVMAIEQIRQTTKVQNKQLTAENQQLKAQVSQLSEENQHLKQQLTESNVQSEQAQGSSEAYSSLNAQLKDHIATLQDELEVVQRDRDNYKNKFDNLFNQSTMISQQNASERASSVKNLMRLEAENAALQDMNKKLRDRVAELEQCDVESAAIEVNRAEKTVQQLNEVIQDLQERLKQQKIHYTEIIEDHKTTIAALQEELFGGDDDPDRASRAELETKVMSLDQENKTLRSQVMGATAQPPRQNQQGATRYTNEDMDLDRLLSMVNGQRK